MTSLSSWIFLESWISSVISHCSFHFELSASFINSVIRATLKCRNDTSSSSTWTVFPKYSHDRRCRKFQPASLRSDVLATALRSRGCVGVCGNEPWEGCGFNFSNRPRFDTSPSSNWRAFSHFNCRNMSRVAKLLSVLIFPVKSRFCPLLTLNAIYHLYSLIQHAAKICILLRVKNL